MKKYEVQKFGIIGFLANLTHARLLSKLKILLAVNLAPRFFFFKKKTKTKGKDVLINT